MSSAGETWFLYREYLLRKLHGPAADFHLDQHSAAELEQLVVEPFTHYEQFHVDLFTELITVCRRRRLLVRPPDIDGTGRAHRSPLFGHAFRMTDPLRTYRALQGLDHDEARDVDLTQSWKLDLQYKESRGPFGITSEGSDSDDFGRLTWLDWHFFVYALYLVHTRGSPVQVLAGPDAVLCPERRGRLRHALLALSESRHPHAGFFAKDMLLLLDLMERRLHDAGAQPTPDELQPLCWAVKLWLPKLLHALVLQYLGAVRRTPLWAPTGALVHLFEGGERGGARQKAQAALDRAKQAGALPHGPAKTTRRRHRSWNASGPSPASRSDPAALRYASEDETTGRRPQLQRQEQKEQEHE